ncbi:hypothetical protein BD408DRAFT_338317 [Parasitella parasitica]|nr:hypothetical protein BD408DRAFT_338317 [Parasitella parasitica]
MGKNKGGGGYNLFESYLASGLASQSPSTDIQHIPLPDSMRTSTLLEQIGQDRKWSEPQIQQDIQTMELNRLYYVSDLRELSKSSWKAIELLPIVKDLLRKALNPGGMQQENKKDKKKMKQKKKEKKKEKKEKKSKIKSLGSPISTGSFPLSDGRDEKPLFAEGVVSEDPETIRNTIQNLKVDTAIDEPMSPSSPSSKKKSVSFSELDPINVGTPPIIQQVMNGDEPNTSSSSSSSSSSSNSSCSDSEFQKKPKVFTGRPIKSVGGNRIRVRTNDGDIFEADQYCPHKKVDLLSYGQVVGRTLICTKHNWKFSLDTGFAAKGGRSINPCKVNDW